MSYSQNPYYANLSQHPLGVGGPGGGGGFIASPGSADSPSSGRRSASASALRPVTIKQILTCEQPHADAEFVLDNAELTSIAIVAQIRTIQHGATNMKLTLSDGTGTIDARKWNENGNADGEGPTEEDKLREAGIVEDAYIYAMGSLKTLSGKRSININTVRLVESPYEVFYHIHHAMVARLYYTRGPPNGTAPGARGPDGDVNMYNTGPNGISGYSNTASPYARAGSSSTNGAGPMTLDPQYATLSPLEKGIVSAILQQRQGADGVNVSAIARSLQGQADANAISDALDKLMDDGHLFTTIDESHYDVST